MKKILGIVCLCLLYASVNTYAQEVHGVETKLAKYSGPIYVVDDNSYDLWFGYSFTNMNSIHVSVEAELYRIYYNEAYKREEQWLVTTKSFILGVKETYIWKFETNSDFKVYHIKDFSDEVEERLEPFGRSRYYIKYKAYKIL